MDKNILDVVGDMSAKDIKILINKLNKISTYKSKLENMNNSCELTPTMMIECYCHMLNNKTTTNNTIKAVVELHKKDVGKVNKEKYYNIGKLSRIIVNKHMKHPLQKSLIKTGNWDKQILLDAKNITQLLNRLYMMIQSYVNYERNNKSLSKNDVISIMSIPKTEPVILVNELVRLGFTQNEIALMLDKNVRTIRRYLSVN